MPVASRVTYPCAVRRCASFFVVVPDFVEVVFVQLPDEAREVAVLEVFRKDVFREFLVLFLRSELGLCLFCGAETCLEHDEAVAFIAPSHHILILRALQHPARGQPLTCGCFGNMRCLLIQLAHLHTVSRPLSCHNVHPTHKIARIVGRLATLTAVHPDQICLSTP